VFDAGLVQYGAHDDVRFGTLGELAQLALLR
jgi:hypothetical protein